jgi:hypothetical protein
MLDSGYITLRSGYTLYWQRNEVGTRRYFSDEIGGGTIVWDTALVDANTLLEAIAQEAHLNRAEIREKQNKNNKQDDF